jgi:hypothetical protein
MIAARTLNRRIRAVSNCLGLNPRQLTLAMVRIGAEAAWSEAERTGKAQCLVGRRKPVAILVRPAHEVEGVLVIVKVSPEGKLS